MNELFENKLKEWKNIRLAEIENEKRNYKHNFDKKMEDLSIREKEVEGLDCIPNNEGEFSYFRKITNYTN